MVGSEAALEVSAGNIQPSRTDESQLLGKFLYYSLADVLVQKEDFEHICTALNFPYTGRRISVVDAFKNATGKVTRRTVAGASGSQEIFRIYCFAMPFSFPKRLFFHNLSATYSFGRRIKGRAAERRIKGRAADFISATRPSERS